MDPGVLRTPSLPMRLSIAVGPGRMPVAQACPSMTRTLNDSDRSSCAHTPIVELTPAVYVVIFLVRPPAVPRP